MNTAEIVVSEVQRDSGFQVRQLFAERICEPRKAPHRHSHREVLSLHEASRNLIGVQDPPSRTLDITSVMRGGEYLALRRADRNRQTASQAARNRRPVRRHSATACCVEVESVRGELDAIAQAVQCRVRQ